MLAPHFVGFSLNVLGITIGCWFALLVGWALARKRFPDTNVFSYLVVFIYLPSNVWFGYEQGFDTSPWTIMTMVAGISVAAILLELPVIYFALALGTVTVTSILVLESTGVLPHAPALREATYYEAHASMYWRLTVGSVSIAGMLTGCVLIVFLVRLWRQREAELALAYRELSNTRDQLVRAESLAAVGSLVEGAAHELRNPLASSGALFQSLREDIAESWGKPEGKSEALETVEMALKGQQRAAAIVERLYGLTDDLETHGSRIALESGLGDLEERYPTIAIEVADNARNLSVPQALIYTILPSLMDNALEAGGTEPPRVCLAQADGNLVASVTDSGRAIPEDQQAEVFKPFFTGEKVGAGHGVGLGLYIVHELVTRFDGSIEIESETGRGTRVTMKLPLTLTK